jgi:hypothetical protein
LRSKRLKAKKFRLPEGVQGVSVSRKWKGSHGYGAGYRAGYWPETGKRDKCFCRDLPKKQKRKLFAARLMIADYNTTESKHRN